MKIFNQIKHLLMLSSGQLRILGLCLFSPSPLGEGRGEGLSVPIVILYVTLNKLLVDSRNALGGCVVWCERTQRVFWTAIPAAMLLSTVSDVQGLPEVHFAGKA